MTKYLVSEHIRKSIQNNKGENMFKLDGELRFYDRDKTKAKTAYGKVKWKDEHGKFVFPSLKFNNIVVASAAKMPIGWKEGQIPKYITVGVQNMDTEQIAGGDYIPKRLPDDATDEEKVYAEENYKKGITKLVSNTSDLSQCLTLISDIFFDWMLNAKKNISQQYKKPWINDDDVKVLRSYQSIVKDEDGNKTELKNKFFRLIIDVYRAPLDNKRECGRYEGRIGYYDQKKRVFNDIVKNSDGKPLQIKGKKVILTYKNIGDYITYKSKCSGHLSFENVVISDKGISLKFTIRDLNVKRHRSTSQRGAQTEQDFKESIDIDNSFDQPNSDEEEDLDLINKDVEAVFSDITDEDAEKQFNDIEAETAGSEPDEADIGNDTNESDEEEEVQETRKTSTKSTGKRKKKVKKLKK